MIEPIVLEADCVTGGYGSTMVLREFSLRVPRGSIYGFFGPNGAGKTTAIRMFLGLLRPMSGAIRLFGETLPSGLPAILRRTGALIEQPSLYDHLTGQENIEIVRKLRGLRPSATDRALEATGVQPFAGFTIPVGVALVCMIAAGILGRVDLAGWWPWSMPADSLPFGIGHVPASMLVSPLAFSVILVVGGWRLSRREVMP